MAYGIDININFGGTNSTFQNLIEANQKLQATIDGLSKTIVDNGNKTKASTDKGKASLADYTGSYEKLTVEIKKNRAALFEELKALQEIRKANKDDSAAIEQHKNKVVELEASIRKQTQTLNQYNKTLGITQTQTKKTSSSLDSLTKGFNQIGAVLGVSAGAYGAFRALQYGIKVIADFDLAQAKLRSILGETKKGMEEVSESAIRVGQNSIFGAKGVTELQIELAKMGFVKQDIIDMQEAIVNLATATQEDLASSAEVVANIIRAYSLTASDATRVTNIMGKAFNDSALDLANFRESIKYVAPIAAQANFKFEETVALLEQLSNVGLKGSLAGTGLTNIISRLGDANSKFSKTLGRTVTGFDEFLAAMIELKKRGADLGDTFELVDRRAAAAFTIIMEGVDDIEEFRTKLQSVDDVMKNQTAVQLDTITNKWKLMIEAINSSILSLDSGNSIFSRTLKGWIDQITTLLNLITNVKNETAAEDIQKTINVASSVGLEIPKSIIDQITNLLDKATEAEVKAARQPIAAMASKYKAIADSLRAQADTLIKSIGTSTEFVIKNMAVVRTEEIRKSIRGSGEKEYYDSLARTILNLQKSQDTIKKGGGEFSKEYKMQTIIINELNKELEAYQKTKKLNKESDIDNKKTIQDAIRGEIELLELKKRISAEEIKILQNGYGEKIKLSQNEIIFDLQIAKAKYDLAIKSGEDRANATEKYGLEVELIERKHANELKSIWEDIAKEAEKINEKTGKIFIERAKSRVEQQKDLMEQYRDMRDRDRKEFAWKKENPILSALGFKEDDEEFIKTLEDGFKLAEDFVMKWADKYVEQTERVVDARNNMVDEAEQALQTEIALAEAGFASNVTLRRKELADAKKEREQAMAEAKKARIAQAKLETAQQAGQLISAAANIFATMTLSNPLGVVLAGIAIGGMMASFLAFKKKAMEAAKTDKYASGGWVRGKSHSEGGTMIEAEDKEFVIRKSMAIKHKHLVESINRDEVHLDKSYINHLKDGVIIAKVSLDDSADLKAIRKALETRGREVSFYNGYRIEKQGNTITKIRMN